MRYEEEKCLRERTLCAVWRREVFEREDTVCGMEKRGVYVASVSLGCAALSRHLHCQCSGVLICGLARPMR